MQNRKRIQRASKRVAISSVDNFLDDARDQYLGMAVHKQASGNVVPSRTALFCFCAFTGLGASGGIRSHHDTYGCCHVRRFLFNAAFSAL